MTQQQAQTIIDISRQIESIDFDSLVQKAYPERTDLENIALSQINLPEFIYLSKKVFNQFVNEFQERENNLFLPFVYIHPVFGNAQLDSQVQTYFTNVNAANFASAEHYLLWLAGYQVENSFFNKPLKSASGSVSNSLQKLVEKLGVIELNIENKVKEVQALFEKLDESNKEINSFIVQKREELQTITNNLTTSNTQATQINELLTKGTESNSRLNTLLEQQEKTKEQSDKKLVELQTVYDKTSEELSQHVKSSLAQIDDFKRQVEENQGHLNFVEGKRKFFEERITYLESLIGREVGASLFETFKQRKVELETPVQFWRWAVPIMALATIAWVFFLFKTQPPTSDVNHWWEIFAVNTLKSIPAIFLLLFSINQYRKERNFQEEYAFKSAVALTIDAYSERLNDPANQDKLIMEAVLNIYKTPIEERQTGRIKNKSALETIKTMAETTTELVKGSKK
jgi:hypothetical protein